MTIAMKMSRLVSLAGSLLTFIQMILLASENDGICFNNGCEIVDSLTTVPPIYFNIGGFFFFQAVYWGVWFAREQRRRLQFVNMLLLAGLAAEGVLVSFQYYIAETFCTYCLIILVLVVLLNCLGSLRHIVSGVAVFSAVLIGFSSLQFSAPKVNIAEDLDRGSFAVLAGQKSEKKHYLFFSSTCKYCEKVMDSLGDENSCTVRFNPIDEISDFSIERAKRAESYSTDVNRNFLKSVGIEQIPVFLSINEAGFEIVKGEGPIKEYLQKTCTVEKILPAIESSIGFSSSTNLDFVSSGLDDSCAVDTDCEDPNLIPNAKQ